jgi:uridine kinase
LIAIRPYLIGIAGPSGAGKTTLARAVASRLEAVILSLDSYYRELGELPLEERAKVNFDEPAALDRDLLVRQLTDLARGQALQVPIYDFGRHTRAPECTILEPAPFVVVEGLFALYWPEVRALLGTRVFVTAEDPVCYGRRLERDVRERGRTEESVFSQYTQTVRPMAERHILPTRAYADVVVSGCAPLERTCSAVLEHVSRTLRLRPAGA